MYFPINVDIREKKCLIVGGGKVAQRKVFSLLEAGASVQVVSPQVTEAIADLAQKGDLKLKLASFEASDMESDTFLVIGATNQPEVQNKVVALAEAQNKLVNIVDQPEHCNFTVPSKLQRGKLTLTISTDGASPGLSRRIREQLEGLFGNEYATLLDWMAETRRDMIEQLETDLDRKEVFDRVLDSDVLDLLKQGKEEEARKLFNSSLQSGIN